jgi:hypothetical protein
MLSSHSILTDESFELLFQTSTLDPALFTHEAHLRLAWIHLNKYGVEQAKVNISSQLQHYVNVLGASEKYHHTLTIAAVEMVGHFIRKSRSQTFMEFISEFPQLKNNFRGLIRQHYKRDIFSCDRARIHFIEPDLLPFE